MSNGNRNLQPLQCWLDVRELKKNCLVGDPLVVEHEANFPDNGGEADTLEASQVVQNDLTVSRWRCHAGKFCRERNFEIKR